LSQHGCLAVSRNDEVISRQRGEGRNVRRVRRLFDGCQQDMRPKTSILAVFCGWTTRRALTLELHWVGTAPVRSRVAAV
jgi:hypothetical protein